MILVDYSQDRLFFFLFKKSKIVQTTDQYCIGGISHTAFFKGVKSLSVGVWICPVSQFDSSDVRAFPLSLHQGISFFSCCTY